MGVKSSIFSCIILSISIIKAQNSQLPLTVVAPKGKGIGIVTADSSFSLNFQFRMQNRAAYVSKTEDDLSPESFEFRVRRLRLKFDGFIYNPKLSYYIQLSFSRGDMDWRGTDNSVNNHSPNVVRDAVIFYKPIHNLRLSFGQTKLPGNRQRVISSGDQQFADRSIVNATFTLDRDFGFFAHYTTPYLILRGALTSGEGRNSVTSNSGLSYTGRMEVLPFGKFTGSNDYIEGDLEREPKPKLSIAATYNFNDLALRQAGQLGNDLYQARSLKNTEVDILFKYRGWAWYNEFMTRHTNNAVTVNPTDTTKLRTVYVGEGYLTQLSYLFKNNYEIAARYSTTIPFSAIYNNAKYTSLKERRLEQVELGITKYLNKHRLKIQGNVVYGKYTNMVNKSNTGFWSGIFQIELGI